MPGSKTVTFGPRSGEAEPWPECADAAEVVLMARAPERAPERTTARASPGAMECLLNLMTKPSLERAPESALSLGIRLPQAAVKSTIDILRGRDYLSERALSWISRLEPTMTGRFLAAAVAAALTVTAAISAVSSIVPTDRAAAA